jgi:Ca2+-binding RTX toxin-like protein
VRHCREMIRLAAIATLALALGGAAAASVAAPRFRCAPARAAPHVTRTGTCLIGTDRADVLLGTAAGDRIYGWAGPDRILGGGGDDRISGGSGDDVVSGGPGNDVIDPSLGRDRVNGGPGNDLIKTRGGERDVVTCGPGVDVAEVDTLDVVAQDCEVVRVARGYG